MLAVWITCKRQTQITELGKVNRPEHSHVRWDLFFIPAESIHPALQISIAASKLNV